MSALLSFTAARLSLRGRTILEDVSFDVRAGERVALIGPNGAGKTTLLRAALGLIAPDAGEVKLGAGAAASLGPLARAARAAYLPQRAQAAWPIRVEALVTLGRFAYGGPLARLSKTDRDAVERAMEAADVARLRDRPLDELSGGEQARAHLARALAQGAPLLLLDEPTANLDPAQSARVAETMRALPALVFATHDLATALAAATRAIVVSEGRILADGPVRETLSAQTLERAFGRAARIVEGAVVFA